ncbi:MAG: hypothetical protein ACREKL_08535, partial [Chthoniobacterales bacterium]
MHWLSAACAGVAVIAAFGTLHAGYVPPTSNRLVFNFNYDWKFIKKDVAGADATSFNDSTWSQVTLPHSWN